MQKQFITHKIALKLKELGFNEECFGYFDKKGNFDTFQYHDLERTNSILQSDFGGEKECTAPIWQQVIDWLREKYDLHIDNGWCISDPFGNRQCGYGMSVYDKIKDEFLMRDFNLDYYKAREQAVLKTIELISNK